MCGVKPNRPAAGFLPSVYPRKVINAMSTSLTKSLQAAPARVWMAAACLALATVGAQATTLVTQTTTGGSHNLSWNAGATYTSNWTGARNMSYGGGTPFWAYCIDPQTGINGAATYTTTSLSNFLTGGRYTSQFGQTSYTNIQGYGYNDQNTSTILSQLTNLYSHAYADSLTSATKASAFGYAVWEIMGESAYSTAGGGLRTNETGTAWRTQVDAYLSALSTNSWSNVNGVNLSTTTNFIYTVYYTAAQGASQTFLRVTAGGGGGSVPEPGSLALVASALFAAGYGARRKRTQH
jgi:PEP-CTERM motif